MNETEFSIEKINEALYALNRAIGGDPEHPSDLQMKLIQARDNVWTVLTTLEPTRKD